MTCFFNHAYILWDPGPALKMTRNETLLRLQKNRHVIDVRPQLVQVIGSICTVALFVGNICIYMRVQNNNSTTIDPRSYFNLHTDQGPLTLSQKLMEIKLDCSEIKSIYDLEKCYPNRLVRELGDSCLLVETWNDVQRCMTGRFTKEPLKHYQIHILGERNSGTKFVMRELQRCFPRFQFGVKVHRDFVRAKHFFQPIVAGDFKTNILIVVFRDPVEWVAAMREKPYHSPNHILKFENQSGAIVPLPWKEFVTRAWTTKRSEFDKKLVLEDRVKETMRGDICRERFAFHEVLPCRYDNTTSSIPDSRIRGFEPIYEMRRDGSGEPFDNILEMRSDKIVNLLLEMSMMMDLGGYMAVRYEDLLREGTKSLLTQVATMVGMDNVPEHCSASGPQANRIGRRKIPIELRQWVQTHSVTKTERLLGYLD